MKCFSNAKSKSLGDDLLFTVNKHLLQPNSLVTLLRLLWWWCLKLASISFTKVSPWSAAHPSVHPFIHLSVHPSICLYNHLSLHMPVHSSVCQSIYLSGQSSVPPSTSPSVCLSINLSVQPSVPPSVSPSIYLSVQPSVPPSASPCVHSCACPSICFSRILAHFVFHEYSQWHALSWILGK